MTLDDKLREIKGTVMSHIFQTKADAKEWQVKVTVQLTDEAIAQIHQAFEDEGYVKKDVTVLPSMDKPMFFDGTKTMTGQEWYDRFVVELDKDGEIAFMGVGVAKEVAKKAAGLE